MPDAASYDVLAAKRSGYSDSEIADYLSSQEKFDAAGARKSGYGDREIIEHLTGKKLGPRGAGETAVGGAIKGVANTLATAATVGTGPVGGAFKFATGKTIGEVAQPILEAGANKLLNVFGQRPLVYSDTSELQPEDRPFAVGGEIAGGSIVPGMGVVGGASKAALATAAPLKSVLGRAAQGVVKYAAEHPVRSLAAEGLGAAGAGIGGGAAEAVDPGNPYAQAAGAIIGGVAAPTVTGANVVRLGIGTVKRIGKLFSSGQRENEAASILQAGVKAYGQDPEQVALDIERSGDALGKQLSGTSGTLSSHPYLIAVEKKLADEKPSFNDTMQTKLKQTFADLRQGIDVLTARGDLPSLKAAAGARGVYYDKIISEQISQAETKAQDAVARLGAAGARSQAEAGQEAYGALRTSLDDARAIETSLHKAIPKVDVGTSELRTAYQQLYKDGLLFKQQKLPSGKVIPRETPTIDPATDKRIQAIVNPRQPMLVSDTKSMLQIRSRLLDEGRKLRGTKDYQGARVTDILAQGILDDVEKLQLPEVTAARDFSRKLNDKFSRAIAGDLLAKTKEGGLRTPPEVLLDKALSGNLALPEQRLGQLREAAGFPGTPGSQAMLDQMSSAQEKYLRGAAQQLVDPTTGRVSQQRLAKFVQENDQALNQFPDLRADLSDVQSAETALSATTKSMKVMQTKADKAVFSRVADTQDPVGEVAKITASRTPVRDFRHLALVARKGGDRAVSGLKTSVLENALDAATTSSGMSFEKLHSALNEPLAAGLPSRMDMMMRNGVITPGERGRIRMITDQGRKIEQALARDPKIAEEMVPFNGLGDVVVRMIGARAGSLAHKAVKAVTGGMADTGGLIAASAGAKYAQRVLERVPNTRTRDVFMKAANDPKFMAHLLRKPTSEGQRRSLVRQVNGFLTEAGIIAAGEGGDQQQPQ